MSAKPSAMKFSPSTKAHAKKCPMNCACKSTASKRSSAPSTFRLWSWKGTKRTMYLAHWQRKRSRSMSPFTSSRATVIYCNWWMTTRPLPCLRVAGSRLMFLTKRPFLTILVSVPIKSSIGKPSSATAATTFQGCAASARRPPPECSPSTTHSTICTPTPKTSRGRWVKS